MCSFPIVSWENWGISLLCRWRSPECLISKVKRDSFDWSFRVPVFFFFGSLINCFHMFKRTISVWKLSIIHWLIVVHTQINGSHTQIRKEMGRYSHFRHEWSWSMADLDQINVHRRIGCTTKENVWSLGIRQQSDVLPCESQLCKVLQGHSPFNHSKKFTHPLTHVLSLLTFVVRVRKIRWRRRTYE